MVVVRQLQERRYETWLINPNHDRTSCILRGVGKSSIASKYLLHGFTLSRVMSKPANVTQSSANLNHIGPGS